MRLAVILGMMLPGAALADEWAPLNGPEIADVLTNTRLKYAFATQHFGEDGQTLYTADRPSWGSWDVRGDQYCSVWPPSDRWACYDVSQNGEMIRFIADDGSFSDGTVIE